MERLTILFLALIGVTGFCAELSAQWTDKDLISAL